MCSPLVMLSSFIINSVLGQCRSVTPCNVCVLSTSGITVFCTGLGFSAGAAGAAVAGAFAKKNVLACAKKLVAKSAALLVSPPV